MMLEQQGGYETEAYSNPQEAVARYLKDQHAAVITDIRMPEMSGLEVLNKIREINPDARIILISGHEVLPTERETICRKCCSFFAKPLRAGAILAALKKICPMQK